MEIKIKLVRIQDHYFIAYGDDYFLSVKETLTNDENLPIDDPEGHSRSNFRMFYPTNQGDNAWVIPEHKRKFLENNFLEDTMWVEHVGKYYIQKTCHSENYIRRMQEYYRNKQAREDEFTHNNAAQYAFENLSTMFGGDCE